MQKKRVFTENMLIHQKIRKETRNKTLKADTVSNHLLIVDGASEHRKFERLNITVNFPCNFTLESSTL